MKARAAARALALALTLSIAIVGAVASAYVPPPNRIHRAITDTNKASGRDQAIRLELSMQIGDRPAVATGELISHPTGLARLELKGSGGLVERHLLQGNELQVTRNGRPLDDPRGFLPPLFIMQADSPVTLRAALESFDIEAEQIGLATCGENDCLLIGDPDKAIARPEPRKLPGLEAYEAEEDSAAAALDPGIDAEPGLARPGKEPVEEPDGPLPSRLWVETESYEIRGFDSADGVRVRLGPIVAFDKLRVPAWFTVEEPGRAMARFDVVGATQVTAPASAFGRDWLFASPDGDPEAPSPAP